MEALQPDSAMPLEEHKRNVLGAINSLAEEAGAGKSKVSPGENPFVNELIPAAAGLGAVGALITVREESRSSMFVGGTGGKAAKARTPLVPQGYGDKKAALKDQQKAAKAVFKGKVQSGDALFDGQVALAHQSLTGSVSSGGAKSKIQGTNITPDAVKALGGAHLLQDLANTNRAIQNPYESGTKRLIADLTQGNDAAEKFVQAKPEIIENIAKTAPEFAAKIPTGPGH